MGPVAFNAVPNGNILFPAMRILESCYISQLNGGYLSSWLKGMVHILFIKMLSHVFGIERNLLKVCNIYPVGGNPLFLDTSSFSQSPSLLKRKGNAYITLKSSFFLGSKVMIQLLTCVLLFTRMV